MVLAAALLALLALTSARADGEAGVVVQNGEQVTTYCIAFKGDSITGDQLLKAAGISFEAFGQGAVCSLNDVGCFGAKNVSDCFCKCQGASCTYWAFFTQKYGANWLYSALGLTLAKARDGDLHGWKWGPGGPSSAPPPKAITFEQVCGHAPRAGIAPTDTPPPPTAAPSTAAPSPTAAVTMVTTATIAPDGSVTSTASPPLASASPETASTSAAAGPSEAVASPVAPTVVVTITSTAPAATGDSGGGGSSPVATLVTFGAIAAGLAAATGAAVYWRRAHGS